MFIVNVKQVCRQIERKMKFKPAYFYCQHPADKAPVRILLNGYRFWQRGVIRSQMQSRGFVVKFWEAR